MLERLKAMWKSPGPATYGDLCGIESSEAGDLRTMPDRIGIAVGFVLVFAIVCAWAGS